MHQDPAGGEKTWQQLRIEELQNAKIQKIIKENAECQAYRKSHREEWLIESEKLKVECSQEPDYIDKWIYRKGLRLSYLGSMLDDDILKQLGLDFYRKCCDQRRNNFNT